MSTWDLRAVMGELDVSPRSSEVLLNTTGRVPVVAGAKAAAPVKLVIIHMEQIS
jgi:hypothetical protein